MKTIGMVSLGCPKNLTESETLLGILAGAGYIPTSSMQDAEIILINTCSFIKTAVSESLDTIRNYARLKKSASCRCLVVTGCLPQRYGASLKRMIPEVDLWLGVNARSCLLDALVGVEAGTQPAAAEFGNSYLREAERRAPAEADGNPPRLLTTFPATAYLKIAEGCSHSCSYCLIPGLRGRLASRPLEAIYQEAVQLLGNGVREITLVAQDTGSYGKDLYGKPSLELVIKRLASLPDLRWLRIMYLNPSSLTPGLLAAIQEEEKVCRYLDLPFQHASAKVLRLMNRKGDLAANLDIVANLRRLLPGIALRTTLMTGFPGEDRLAFRELLSFVREAGFDRVGVFTYCREEGAPSCRWRETAGFTLKQRRRRQLYGLQRQISRQINTGLVGKELAVLIEKELGEGVYLGRSYREAPDIDPKIIVRIARSDESRRTESGARARQARRTPVREDGLRPGEFVKVRITHAYTFDLAGIVT